MAIPATEWCNSCDAGRHQHAATDHCARPMYGRDFYCACEEPATGYRCGECERVIAGSPRTDGERYLHPGC